MPLDSREPGGHPDNIALIEELHARWREDPSHVAHDWRAFFQELDEPRNGVPALYLPKLSADDVGGAGADLTLRSLLLIQAYRRNGHFAAAIDPLGRAIRDRTGLDPALHGLAPEDLDRQVTTRIAGRFATGRLSDFTAQMERTYCGAIGVEYFYIQREDRRRWLMERMESGENSWPLPESIQRLIHSRLCGAELFEQFAARRFPGKKRFSLEGAESLIPVVSGAVELGGEAGIDQIVIGMAHRGRLNVLANVLGKDPAAIFAEFNENVPDDSAHGDVKYHLGFSSDVATLGGRVVHLSLAFNPSHLEVINPVVLGSVRARQTRGGDEERRRYMPILIHGDAAFSGQGINYEILNMSRLPGYSVGGTFHIICNNQVGFTTNPREGRSTQYCTDIAKMLQVPILHVNGDDPEACFRAVQIRMEWRHRYATDVFLDLVCYRRWGHNEADEPSYTQPGMYRVVRSHPTTVALYERTLIERGVPESQLSGVRAALHEGLEAAYREVEAGTVVVEREALAGDWSGFQAGREGDEPDTALPAEVLASVALAAGKLPAEFHLHPKLVRLVEERRNALVAPNGRVDWGLAEWLTYGSLLREGIPVRLTGQDVVRGTFSHRHAGFYDADDDRLYVPLAHISPDQGAFELVNSPLSELGALGFEFGYSLADPRTLVVWEAQFGDFTNGAQVIIDQFISSSEAKWNRMSGLVLLLPHGYEGQGPEHSSARLERFLQLCSQNNMQVCNLTTPAQFFHLLRRQIRRSYRKPLVIMSPKSLLRHPSAVSAPVDFASGAFRELIDDPARPTGAGVRRVVLCTGKIYYELAQARDAGAHRDIAVIRIEQLYPFPFERFASMLQKYAFASEFVWVQEEPRNQGAWFYIEHRAGSMIRGAAALSYVGRPAAPSPATGYHRVHSREQEDVIAGALGAG